MDDIVEPGMTNGDRWGGDSRVNNIQHFLSSIVDIENWRYDV